MNDFRRGLMGGLTVGAGLMLLAMATVLGILLEREMR